MLHRMKIHIVCGRYICGMFSWVYVWSNFCYLGWYIPSYCRFFPSHAHSLCVELLDTEVILSSCRYIYGIFALGLRLVQFLC